jgi:hypothetical protein
MTDDKRVIDWERIELDYRAGLLSLREIAGPHGLSDTAIRKRAKRDSWTRDLSAKIKSKAEELVRKSEVRKQVRIDQKETEKETVDANAQVIANVRIEHRADICRARRLSNKLLEELEGLTDNRQLFDDLGEMLRDPSDSGVDRRNDLYQKVIDLPSRSKSMKEMAETLKTLITLEREAFDIAAPAKVEVTGAGGGPIQTESLNVAGLSTEALAEIMSAKDAANRQ